MALKIVLAGFFLIDIMSLSLCCPNNCVICLNSILICNKFKQNQILSGKYSINTVNEGAFVNAEIVTLLDMSNTFIEIIESGAFEGLDNLETLDLSDNSIAVLPDGIFTPLSKLKSLDLSENSLPFLNPKAFVGLTNLTKLYLNNNQLVTISDDEITDLLHAVPSLQNVTFASNRWHCDCNITYFRELLDSDSFSVDDKSSVMCRTPPELNNNIITSLDFYTNPNCYSAIPSPTPSPSPSLFSTLSPSSSLFPTLSPSPLLSSSPSLSQTPSFLLSPSPSSFSFSSPSPTSSILLSSLFSSSLLLSPSPFIKPSSATTQTTSSSSYSPSISSSSLSRSAASSSYSLSSSQSSIVTSSSTTSSSTTVRPSPIPTLTCPSTSAETAAGNTEWDETVVGESSSSDCPYGPDGVEALRNCFLSPNDGVIWGEVQDGGCFTATNFLQTLSNGITKDTAFSYSEMLLDLPFNSLTKTDMTFFVDIVSQLISVAAGDDAFFILGNVLDAVNEVLSSDSVNSLSGDLATVLQNVISTAVFNIIIEGNNPEVILDFGNLYIGGKYIGDGESVEVVVNIRDDSGLLFVRNGTIATSPDIKIEYDKDGSTDVNVIQITVYANNSIYLSGCNDESENCDSEVLSPVTVVTTDGSGTGYVNVTFDGIEIRANETGDCAVWNSSLYGGIGGWEISLCKTIIIAPGKIMCECEGIGAIAIIEIPINDTIPTNDSALVEIPLAIRVSFYVGCGLGIIFHLPIIIASFIVCYRHEFVRNIQALLNHAVAQTLVFAVIPISFQRNDKYEVCLGLSSLIHYSILVVFMWLMFRSIVLLMSRIQRKLYERDCFILPFIFMAWALPIIPIAIYGVLTFTSNNVEDELNENCWMESFIFPNYFTYLALIFTVLVMVAVIIITIIMAVSGYEDLRFSYMQSINILIETAIFCGVIVLHFITASQQTNTLLVATAGAMLLCGIYFFLANGFGRTKIRDVLICEKESYSKGKPFSGQDTPTTSSSMTSKSSKRLLLNRRTAKNQQLNLDYIPDYLGYPIEMMGQVRSGKRVRKPKGLLSNGPKRGVGSSEV